MPFLLHVMAAGAMTPGHPAVLLAWHSVAAVIPNPPAQAPPGVLGKVNTILGWGKWGVLASGIAGLLISAGKMTIGHRNRSALAVDGATGVPWMFAGLSLVAASAALATVFL